MEQMDFQRKSQYIASQNANESAGDVLGSPRLYSPMGEYTTSPEDWKVRSMGASSILRSPGSTRKTVKTPDVLRTSLHHADWILLEALDPEAAAKESAKARTRPKLVPPDSRDRQRALNNGEEREKRHAIREYGMHVGPLSSHSHTGTDLHLPRIQTTLSPGFTDLLSPTSQFTDGPISPLESSISSLQQTLHSTTTSLARSVQNIRKETQLTSEKLNTVTSSIDLEEKDWNTSEEEDEWGVVMSSATRAAHSRLQRAYTSLSGAMYEFGQLDENQELFMIGAVSLEKIKDESNEGMEGDLGAGARE